MLREAAACPAQTTADDADIRVSSFNLADVVLHNMADAKVPGPYTALLAKSGTANKVRRALPLHLLMPKGVPDRPSGVVLPTGAPGPWCNVSSRHARWRRPLEARLASQPRKSV